VEGADYIVMEYIDGVPLNRLRPDEGFALTDVLKYGQRILAALEAAHAEGIIHRDIERRTQV
jgi:serine/threonine protein kinase